jgi:hypothetical protein
LVDYLLEGCLERAIKAWEKELMPIGRQDCRHIAATWLDAAGISLKTSSMLTTSGADETAGRDLLWAAGLGG